MAFSDVKTRSQMFSSIQCPYCNRKFCEQAAEKHIKYCQEKSKLMQNNNKKIVEEPEIKKTSAYGKAAKSARVHYDGAGKQPTYREFIELE